MVTYANAPVNTATSLLPLRRARYALAERDVTAMHLTMSALAVVEACKADINAFSVVAAETALTAAAESDRRYASGRARLLEGLPIAVKDMIDTEGVETRYGSAAYRGHVPMADAEAVRRLRRAGAIIVGKTTTHEFAWGVTTRSRAFGDTLNPLDRTRIPGGSSGGGAAAVAYGAIAGGLGTDTGGSVRIPAAFCGCVGFKPTLGMLPTAGVFPLAPTLDHIGLIGASVDDVVVMAEAFGIRTSNNEGRGTCSLGVIRTIPPVPLSQEVGAAFDRAVAALDDGFAAEVCCVDALFEDLFAAFAGIVLAEAGMAHFARHGAAMIADTYEAETVERLNRARSATLDDYARHQERRRRFRTALINLMSKTDYLVLPTCPCLPPKVNEGAIAIGPWSGDIREAAMTYTAPFNLAGFPAISIPLKSPGQALPAALQIVARPGEDGKLLSIAQKIEAIVGATMP